MDLMNNLELVMRNISVNSPNKISSKFAKSYIYKTINRRVVYNWIMIQLYATSIHNFLKQISHRVEENWNLNYINELNLRERLNYTYILELEKRIGLRHMTYFLLYCGLLIWQCGALATCVRWRVRSIYTLYKSCKRRKSVIEQLLTHGLCNICINRNGWQSIDRSLLFLWIVKSI